MRLKTGMEIRVTFDDHVKNSSGGHAIRFTARGMISSFDRKEITIDCWSYADPKTERDDNVESFTLLRSTIREIVELVPRPLDSVPAGGKI